MRTVIDWCRQITTKEVRIAAIILVAAIAVMALYCASFLPTKEVRVWSGLVVILFFLIGAASWYDLPTLIQCVLVLLAFTLVATFRYYVADQPGLPEFNQFKAQLERALWLALGVMMLTMLAQVFKKSRSDAVDTDVHSTKDSYADGLVEIDDN